MKISKTNKQAQQLFHWKSKIIKSLADFVKKKENRETELEIRKEYCPSNSRGAD